MKIVGKIKKELKSPELLKEPKDPNEANPLEGVVPSLENDRRIKALETSWAIKGALITLSVVVVCLLGVVSWQMLRPKNEIAYVVEIDTSTGTQRINGAVSEIGQYTMSEWLVLNSIKNYVVNLRSVSNDAGVNTQRIREVYAYSTEQASQFVSNWVNDNNPIDRSKTEYVEVVIYNATPINNASSEYMKFLVDWNEITRDSNGRIRSEKNYRADIDAKQFKATKSTSDLNPVGLYVCHINISEIKDGFVVKPTDTY